MAIVTTKMPATLAFVRKYATLFEERLHPDTLTSSITLRKGAPILQMLTAPDDFVQGSAEPWIVNVLGALLTANDAKVVLETGTFIGQTAVKLCHALHAKGGGRFLGCEIEADRAAAAQQRLESAVIPLVHWTVYHQDVLQVVAAQPDGSLDFVWVDDDHTAQHVHEEITALLPKMRPGGLICGHDVHGTCDLQVVFRAFGGIALDLPRLGPAGGLGIIQC